MFPLQSIHENRAYTSRDDSGHTRSGFELQRFTTFVSNQLGRIFHSCLPLEAVPLQHQLQLRVNEPIMHSRGTDGYADAYEFS